MASMAEGSEEKKLGLVEGPQLPSDVQVVFHLVLMRAPWGGHYSSHFRDKEADTPMCHKCSKSQAGHSGPLHFPLCHTASPKHLCALFPWNFLLLKVFCFPSLFLSSSGVYFTFPLPWNWAKITSLRTSILFFLSRLLLTFFLFPLLFPLQHFLIHPSQFWNSLFREHKMEPKRLSNVFCGFLFTQKADMRWEQLGFYL